MKGVQNISVGQGGFTLIELMVAVTVLGILLALAIPSFVDLMRNSQRSSAVNDLLADMTFARSESARRGRIMAVCANDPGSDTGKCAGASDWVKGWIVFQDTNGSGARDADEEVVRRASARTASLLVASDPKVFRLRPFNQRSDAGRVTFCDPRDKGLSSAKHSREIVISVTGRVRIAENVASGCT